MMRTLVSVPRNTQAIHDRARAAALAFVPVERTIPNPLPKRVERVCAYRDEWDEQCTTVISQYNDGNFCHVHGQRNRDRDAELRNDTFMELGTMYQCDECEHRASFLGVRRHQVGTGHE